MRIYGRKKGRAPAIGRILGMDTSDIELGTVDGGETHYTIYRPPPSPPARSRWKRFFQQMASPDRPRVIVSDLDNFRHQ
jgi:hypothetical protein